MVVQYSPTCSYVPPSPFLPTRTTTTTSEALSSKRRLQQQQQQQTSVHTYVIRTSHQIYNKASTPTPSSTSNNGDKGENESKSSTDSRTSSWRPFKSWTPAATNTDLSPSSPSQHDINSDTVNNSHSEKLTSSSSTPLPIQTNNDDATAKELFRWPWQKNNNTSAVNLPSSESNYSSTGMAPTDLKATKKHLKHNDSKPGASIQPNDDGNANASLQERWRSFVSVIIPSKEDTPSLSSVDKTQQDIFSDSTVADNDDVPPRQQRGGIFELYRPPSQPKQQNQQNGKSKWFSPPWVREPIAPTHNMIHANGDNPSTKSSDEPSSPSSWDPAAPAPEQIDNDPSSSSQNGSAKTQQPWFTPPWKRQTESSPDDSKSSNLESDIDHISKSPNNGSAFNSPPNSTSPDKTLKKNKEQKTVKITLPSKKPWFRWPGTRQTKDESNVSDMKRDGNGEASTVKTTTSTVPSAVEKTNSPGDSSISQKEAEQFDDNTCTDRNDSDNDKDSDTDKSEGDIERKHSELVTASTRNSSNTPGYTIETYSIPQRDISQIRQIFGSETFFATDTIPAPGGLLFHGNLRGEPQETVDKLEERLFSRFGDKYTLCLAEGEDQGPVVVVVPTSYHELSAAPRHQLLAIGLAMMTISTCLSRGLVANVLRGRIIQGYGLPIGKTVISKFMFSPIGGSATVAGAIGLMVVLSQVVRRMVASWYRTKLAIPFMLPSYQLGSFGAVVYLVSPAPNRAALFDIAISSTIAMIVPAMICLIIGLRLSTSFASVFPVPMSMVSGSLVMGCLTRFVPNGQILVDYQRSLIGLHPLAIIGANCLTIAALNLLPIRQLDGNRIIAALFGRRAALKAWRISVLYLLFASSKNPYLIMFLLIVSFGPWQVDRPSRNELTEPDNVRTIIGYLFMLLMIGLLLPYPKSSFFGTL